MECTELSASVVHLFQEIAAYAKPQQVCCQGFEAAVVFFKPYRPSSEQAKDTNYQH